jgi:putative transposase
MPCKNAVKEYGAGGYYHLYNRGVNKRTIFKDDKDYKAFLSYLKFYLTPLPTPSDPSDPTYKPDANPGSPTLLQGLSLKVSPSRQPNNFSGEIELMAYCLMPNHFHLMIKQNSDHGICGFMSSVITKYVRYFNTRYKRIGPLFQGRYKAVQIFDEYQFTYLTKYIHRNPLDLQPFRGYSPNMKLMEYKYSSYGNYLHLFNQGWISTEDVLSYFSKTNHGLSYQQFVDESDIDDITRIAPLTIDAE